MKLKLVASLLLTAALCTAPVFADTADGTPTDTAGTSTNESVIQVDSSEALSDILARKPGANGPITVQVSQGVIIDYPVNVPKNVTLNLGGAIVNNDVRLTDDGASVKYGEINGGGIIVTNSADENEQGLGTIIGVTINNAPDTGIFVRPGCVIGNITGNTINTTGSHGIRLTTSTAGDILNNTISRTQEDGISLYTGAKAGKIDGNNLSKIGLAKSSDGDFGIIVNSNSEYDTCVDEICDNNVDGVPYAGIAVHSMKKGSSGSTAKAQHYTAYVKGDIARNTVTNAATHSGKDCEAAIYIDSYGLVKGSIEGNTVRSSGDDGISAITGSIVRGSIMGNEISAVDECSIGVKDSAVVEGMINGNKISSPKNHGMMINNDATVEGAIQKNTITSAKVNGISLTKSAKAGTIKNNTIKNAGTYGVIAGDKSTIKQLASNTISIKNNPKKGMGIISNKGCTITKITGNKISGKYTVGIRLIEGKKAMTVQSNTMVNGNGSSAPSIGISANKCAKLVIKKNKITGNNKKPGIYLAQCKKLSVSGNTVKKSTSKVYIAK